VPGFTQAAPDSSRSPASPPAGRCCAWCATTITSRC